MIYKCTSVNDAGEGVRVIEVDADGAVNALIAMSNGAWLCADEPQSYRVTDEHGICDTLILDASSELMEIRNPAGKVLARQTAP